MSDTASAASSPSSVLATPKRRVAPKRAAVAMMAVAEQATRDRQSAQLQTIIQRLNQEPELIEMVSAMLDVPQDLQERLYRGNRTLDDVPFKHKVGVLAHMLGVDKAEVQNIDNCRSSVPIAYLWATGRNKGFPLAERGMVVTAFFRWYSDMHTQNGAVLRLSIRTDVDRLWGESDF